MIYEPCTYSETLKNGVYVKNSDNTYKHILSVMDLKKMIPIRKDLYSEVSLNPLPTDSEEEKKYKVLLNIEYSFCLKILNSIIQKANKLYEKQMSTGKIAKFCCDFKLLEQKCMVYKTN